MSVVSDTSVIIKRNSLRIIRMPEVLMFTAIQPLMFVVLFAYVFGSAVDVQGPGYREFLLAGVFTQTVIFGATWTGAGIAEDMTKGVIDRFRSLPMSSVAVLLGRTLSDVVINAISMVVMMGTGLAVGWRVRTSFLEAAGGILLLLAFAFAFSWVMAYLGLIVPSVEVINSASFMVIFPMTFIANTFVPLEGFPTPLRVVAEWNPVSSMTQAARDLFGNSIGAPRSDAFAIQHPVAYTLIWIGLLLAVFVPLAVRRYSQAASR